jgi:hypothetical protein
MRKSFPILILVSLALGALLALPRPAGAQSGSQAPSLDDWLPRLRKGSWVKVEGQLLPSGGLRATELKVRNGDIDESQITTTITAMDPSRKQFTTRFGITVQTNGRTEVQASKSNPRTTLATLQAGDRVEVEGKLQKNGALLANEIEIKKPEKPGDKGRDEELTGRIESVDVAARQIVLLGITVYLDENTKNKTPFLE